MERRWGLRSAFFFFPKGGTGQESGRRRLLLVKSVEVSTWIFRKGMVLFARAHICVIVPVRVYTCTAVQTVY